VRVVEVGDCQMTDFICVAFYYDHYDGDFCRDFSACYFSGAGVPHRHVDAETASTSTSS